MLFYSYPLPEVFYATPCTDYHTGMMQDRREVSKVYFFMNKILEQSLKV